MEDIEQTVARLEQWNKPASRRYRKMAGSPEFWAHNPKAEEEIDGVIEDSSKEVL